MAKWLFPNIDAHDQSRLEQCMEAVNLHTENLQMVHLQVVDREGSARGAEILFIGELIIVGMYQIEYNKVHQ